MQRTRTDAPTLELIAEELSPAGEATKRVVRVDACSGHIREHALYDGRGILIARAALADHRIDPPTGLVIPHVISFHWPAMNQSMTLTMGAVQLNPSQTPASVWEVPHKPGAPQFDLSQMLGGRSRAFPAMHGVRSPFGIMPPPDDHALQDSPFTHPEPQQAKADPEIIQTTFEEGAWWDEPATTDGNPATPQSGVSRQHLTRRNTNAFASEPL